MPRASLLRGLCFFGYAVLSACLGMAWFLSIQLYATLSIAQLVCVFTLENLELGVVVYKNILLNAGGPCSSGDHKRGQRLVIFDSSQQSHLHVIFCAALMSRQFVQMTRIRIEVGTPYLWLLGIYF